MMIKIQINYHRLVVKILYQNNYQIIIREVLLGKIHMRKI
jgi:hypothetical protein